MSDELVGRERELAFLRQVVARRRPGPAQLILLYGRRRVGKTSLLRHWAATSGLGCSPPPRGVFPWCVAAPP